MQQLNSWKGERTMLHWPGLSMRLFCFNWGMLTLCCSTASSKVDTKLYGASNTCEVDSVGIYCVCSNTFFRISQFWLSTLPTYFFLQVRVMCVPQMNPSGVWTIPRMSTPTGQWAARPAHHAPSPLSSRWRVSCSASPKTSSNPS